MPTITEEIPKDSIIVPSAASTTWAPHRHLIDLGKTKMN
jgi:hypothetical protein